jgi:hypothetical protein
VQDAIPTVWIVLADDQESGYGDMDNRVDVIGTYANLAVAVADVYRKIIAGDRFYNPTFTQRVIATTLAPLPAPSGWDDAEYRDSDPN